jgi:Cu+-exporting ATPase
LSNSRIDQVLLCYHCGDECPGEKITDGAHFYCCDGCKLVHELLSENDLCAYYDLEDASRKSPKAQPIKNRFSFLDNEVVEKALTHFKSGDQVHIRLVLPQIHCASCVWLLEHLYKLNKGISESRVDFLHKEINIIYDKKVTSLRKVIETLAMTGYEPNLSLEDLTKKQPTSHRSARLFQIVVAGFCFGNIMMLSFPEYFGLSETGDTKMRTVFGYLNFSLSLPVLLFSGAEFFKNAWAGIRSKFLNIDAPIALAIAITFVRSVYEIFFIGGGGYLDSMSGIIFFMLIGRYFQDKTYATLSFDRDYKSYFPLWVTCWRNQTEDTIPISDIIPGDHLLIRNHELIPADSVLIDGEARIDYSFVNGESTPVFIKKGETIYAGGRQCGATIRVETQKSTAQSYLTELWNKDTFSKKRTEKKSFIHAVSKYFTWGVLAISLGSFLAWLPFNSQHAIDALTAVLIVACPCALLLSASFTYGNGIRVLGNQKIYVKGPDAVEQGKSITHVVFDKTGTITRSRLKEMGFVGELSPSEWSAVACLCRESGHPLSRSISSYIEDVSVTRIDDFKEIAGLGLEGSTPIGFLRLGSSDYLGFDPGLSKKSSRTWLETDGQIRGYFWFGTDYREGLSTMVEKLKKEGKRLSLISGDNEAEEEYLRGVFGKEATLLFHQSPDDKLNYIHKLQKQGEVVMMIGDGLNDAGALRASDLGVSISDDSNRFSPSCDVIMDAESFRMIPFILQYSKLIHGVILSSFAISILYNMIGLWFSVRAELMPVVAAILMPASSISIVLFTTGATWLGSSWYKKKLGLQS